MSFRPSWIAITVLLFLGLSWADNKKPQAPASGPTPISQSSRFDIIRALNGELVFIRKPFPMGVKGLVITPDGKLIPDGQDLQMAVAVNGPAAMPGDRARITNMVIKNKMIIFEINGGPMRKKRWYDHLEVGGMGGTVPVSPQSNELRKGSFVALEFDKFVPEITAEQLKQRLAGVFDFNAKSTLEAYVETIPPKAKQAIKEHRVLVGMNRQMVMYSVGTPGKKIREKENNTPYEEWIYGDPPQEVKFVRFVGDEVTRVEIMQVDGQKIVHTAKEIDLKPANQQASAEAQPSAAPVQAPTLRRPGEKPEDTNLPTGTAAGTTPSNNRPPPDIGDPTGPGRPPMRPTGPQGPQNPGPSPFPQ